VETISLARGVPAPECIPVEELADCAKAAVERDPSVLSYGAPSGYVPLRSWIAERHGVPVERIFVTNGSLQGFVFLAELLASNGERVLVEAPTYDRPLKILDGLGAEVVAVPQNADGIDLDELERALSQGPKPAFLYVIPTFQNPSGRSLPAEGRRRLADLAAEHELLVLEDDPYGLVRFEGEAPPTLFELEGGEHVLHSSSFSKIVAPGARVGYLVLPEELARRVEAHAVSTYITPALISQATVFEFLRRGLLDRNLELVRSLLKARRDAMLDALDEQFGGSGAAWNRPEGGYFLWLDLPDGADVTQVLAAAEEKGVTFVPGPDFFPRGGGGGRSAARLAFSFASPAQIADGIGRLAAAVGAAPAVELRQQHAA
jgi:2-aminoadipate transaminase